MAKKAASSRKTPTPESPPSREAPEAPPPPGGGQPTGMHPVVPAVVSLFAPGLGLLMLESRDRVKDALLIFGIWFAYFAASYALTFFVIGLCCWLPLPLFNIAAAIHSHDEATLAQGGKPLLFQKGFRIFKD